MRNKSLYILLVGALLLFAKKVNADVITKQGRVTNDVHIENNVESNGSTTTHIQTSVNGDTKVYDSNKSGSITVHQDQNSYSVTQNGKPVVTTSGTSSAITSGQKKGSAKNAGVNFFSFFSYFINSIRRIFHLS